METYINAITSLGLPTVMLGIVMYWAYHKDKTHRKDWRDEMKRQYDNNNRRDDRYTDLTERNNNILTEIRTMIKTFIDINK